MKLDDDTSQLDGGERTQIIDGITNEHCVQLVGDLTHQLKNVLQSVNGGAHLVRDGLNIGSIPAIDSGWKIVKRNQDKLNRLVMSTLFLVNDYAPSLNVLSVNELIEEELPDLKRLAQHFKLLINWTPDSKVTSVPLGLEGMSLAFANIISEAIELASESLDQESGSQETQNEKTIQVSSQIEGAECNVEVVIARRVELADQDIKDMFTFVSHTNDETAAVKLRRIHLAAANKAITFHGGDLSVYQTSTGGVMFAVRLPMA